jgi:crotonobetainyl-CoA:carnitine CoA-transferase CaiB-like acyl-CoA transferase
MPKQLFSDLLVIDCASFIAGPAAGTILADFGARVIKVEPLSGDGYRLFRHLPGLPVSASNSPWTVINRCKESLAIDLKQSEGRALLDTLVSRADVFITNFPLPVREKLKLRYEDIRAVNPKTIYASLTPYGEEGPESANTGYDATAWWARSGLMDSVRASNDTPPAMSVPGMGDQMSACSLYGAIVTALYRRQNTGEGGMVGTSLMANGLWSNGLMVQAALDGADMSVRLDRDDLSAFTQIYRCGDDRWFILTILPQAQERAWPLLARCVGHEEWLDDPRFPDAKQRHLHNVDLTGLLSKAFQTRGWDQWHKLFAEHGITCGGVAQAADHCDDAQAEAADMLPGFNDGSGRTVNSPIYIDGEAKPAPRPAPGVGEHSAKILADLGFSADAIGNLQKTGVIGG